MKKRCAVRALFRVLQFDTPAFPGISQKTKPGLPFVTLAPNATTDWEDKLRNFIRVFSRLDQSE
jgi:hypothetical protein